MTGDDKWKKLADSTWVRKALAKEIEFDLERTHENFMEVKKSFTEASTSGSKDKPKSKMDPSMLTTFLETCMKLLCDSKAMKGSKKSSIDALGSCQVSHMQYERLTSIKQGWDVR